MNIEKSISHLIITIVYILGIIFGKYTFDYIHLLLYNNSSNIYKILRSIFYTNIIITIYIWFCGIILGTASIYDPYWSVQTIIISLFLLKYSSPSSFSLILLIPIFLYSLRLTCNFMRNFSSLKYTDWRYSLIRKNTGKCFQIVNLVGICIVPTVVVFIGSLPSFYILLESRKPSIGSWIGIFIIILGVYIEYITDEEIEKYKKKRKSREDLIESKYWLYCRHPNYFGEITVWYGIYITYMFSFDYKNEFNILKNFRFFFCPIIVNLLFWNVSIPMEEKYFKTSKKKYEEYTKKVRNKIIPNLF